MPSAAITRDWREVKRRLTQYSTAELTNVLACASHSRAQVDIFIEAVEGELAHREEGPRPWTA